ncbi:MAG: DUF2130 domain-containing protein [Ruminococcus sp.]|nr:DUF2130 domain-containing protein [Ruminococcus sp.]
MNEIICPHCKKAFTIDENDYAKLIAQVRTAEFDKEIHDKLQAETDKQKATYDLDKKETEIQHRAEISEKEKQIEKLKAEIDKFENEKKLAVNQALAEKESEISSLKAQLTTAESEKEIAVSQAVKVKDDELTRKDREIIELKSSLSNKETEKKLAVTQIEQKKDSEIASKNAEIQTLSSTIELKESEHRSKEQTLKANYEEQLKMKDEQIEKYKDFKQRLSTKMVGETLEQHCSIQFNQYRMTAFPNAYFEKDNDSSSGSKGDFIYKDFSDDGTEFISIMFEMKNEADTTATKHKNEDFFKELDKDRNEKKCEYAVLVSMLEADNELYNNGIVDVSYRYPKMYVIRPQFFIPLITLLKNAALNSLEYKKQLYIVQNQQADLTTFESNIETFKNSFLYTYENATKKHKEAIDGIDKAIAQLTKIKEALQTSDKHLNAANNKLESDLTIKRLTKNADSVYDKLIEIRNDNK